MYGVVLKHGLYAGSLLLLVMVLLVLLSSPCNLKPSLRTWVEVLIPPPAPPSRGARTARNRWQHHCRACGRLYCYSCSRFRALLPRSFGTRDPQRLCQPCNARVAPLQESLVGKFEYYGSICISIRSMAHVLSTVPARGSICTV